MRLATSTVDYFGRHLLRALEYSIKIVLMFYVSLRAAFKDRTRNLRAHASVMASQIYFTGFQALPLISVLAMATGSVLILQGSMNFSVFGGAQGIGQFLIASLVREISPLLTAMVVVARSGTAVATELGNMRANREIEALISIGVNPFSHIVFPRLVAGAVSVVCLAFYFSVIALLGGFIMLRFMSDISPYFYFDTLMSSFSRADALIFVLKNSFSGLVIFLVACYQGLSVKSSPHEVPQATTKAVVHSIFFVCVFNMAVTAIFYFSRLKDLGVI